MSGTYSNVLSEQPPMTAERLRESIREMREAQDRWFERVELVYIDGEAIAHGLRMVTRGDDIKREEWMRAQAYLLRGEPDRLPWWNR